MCSYLWGEGLEYAFISSTITHCHLNNAALWKREYVLLNNHLYDLQTLIRRWRSYRRLYQTLSQ